MFIIKTNNRGEGVQNVGVVASVKNGNEWIRGRILDCVEDFNGDMAKDGEPCIFIASTIDPKLDVNHERLNKAMGIESFAEVIGTVWFVGIDAGHTDSGEIFWIEELVLLDANS